MEVAEPPRLLRMLKPLRGWSHVPLDTIEAVGRTALSEAEIVHMKVGSLVLKWLLTGACAGKISDFWQHIKIQ